MVLAWVRLSCVPPPAVCTVMAFFTEGDCWRPMKSQASAGTDALSAITVRRTLDADRSIKVLVDESDVLLAELTFTQGHLSAGSLRNLRVLLGAAMGRALDAGRPHSAASSRSPRSALETVFTTSPYLEANWVATSTKPDTGPSLTSRSSSHTPAHFSCSVPSWATILPVSSAISTIPPSNCRLRTARSI